MRFAGFGFGRQRPDSECSHIKGWNAENPAKNFVINNNIKAINNKATPPVISIPGVSLNQFKSKLILSTPSIL